MPTRLKPATALRSSWRGYLRVSLVTVPVQAFNAVASERSDITFHQLHTACHSRIRYQKVCPIHGLVTNDEIVKGYEYGKNQYVEVEPEELEKLLTEQERALTIHAFVAAEEIDAVYFDGRTYYLAPDGGEAEEPYAVLRDAMQKLGRNGIGEVVFSARKQLALLRPMNDILTMMLLHDHEEIRPSADLGLRKNKSSAQKVKLAEVLINAAAGSDFDFAAHKDRYKQKLEELLSAKIAGQEIVAPEEEQPPQVINLMEALTKSIQQARGGATKKRKPKRRQESPVRDPSGPRRKRRAS